MNEKGMIVSDERLKILYPMLFGFSCALFLLKNAETEIKELKKRRIEDAKANEKVVSIYAAHEQGWLTERKKLRQQIQALLNELQVISTKSKENMSKLNSQMQEKDKLFQEEKKKRIEQEEAEKKAEKTNEELRETLKREAQEHSKEIWKHKSAFIELVSTQRQIEAEMGRAVKQIEAEKQELDAVLEQKEEYVLMTQTLSMELIKTRKDLDQKDKILSAMVRKSKVDTCGKQMLMMSKSKRQQAEVETVPESGHERYSLRSMLSRHHKSKPAAFPGGRGAAPPAGVMPSCTRSPEKEVSSPLSQQFITQAREELVLAADNRKMEGWVRCEAEKCITLLEERHQLEVNAFAEQLRLKDKKLEAFQWHSLSKDLELKRLHSHIEELGHELTRHKEQIVKVEALLLDSELELHSFKQQMESESQLRTATSQKASHPPAITYDDTIWSNVRIIKRKPGEKKEEKDQEVLFEEENTLKNRVLTVQSPDKEFEDKKEACVSKIDVLNAENISLSTWKMDLHALGVFYKIKRLKQQLLMFERVTGKQESCENGEFDDKKQFGVKGFYSLISLINKQVSRYQSLQEKTNDICKRMHENDLDTSYEGPIVAKSKDETKKLEHFLEETFQLQRYIVATGQKLMEIQSKIACAFIASRNDELDEAKTSFDMKKFADCLRTLFREVQRGLEIRISRIIGDLEGPLACDGMIHPRT